MSSAFRINSPNVVAETLDGEATIVDLESGVYYALNESGSLIWDELIKGSGPETVAGKLASAYELDESEAAAAVANLVERLTESSLIVPTGGSASNGAPQSHSNGASPAAAAGAFKPPRLSTYTDMQELLLLDPIHEVDETGWPAAG